MLQYQYITLHNTYMIYLVLYWYLMWHFALLTVPLSSKYHGIPCSFPWFFPVKLPTCFFGSSDAKVKWTWLDSVEPQRWTTPLGPRWSPHEWRSRSRHLRWRPDNAECRHHTDPPSIKKDTVWNSVKSALKVDYDEFHWYWCPLISVRPTNKQTNKQHVQELRGR